MCWTFVICCNDSQPFRSRAKSLPGANRPIELWPICSLELCSQERNGPGTFFSLVHDVDTRYSNYTSPNFRPISVAAKWLHGSRCHLVWSSASATCVRWGPRCPLPKRGRTPKFSAHVYCDQTAVWMKLVLGMVVGLSPGEFVLDGDPAPLPQKGQRPLPNFKGWGWEFRNWTGSGRHFRL